MTRTRISILIGTAVVAAGLGAGLATAVSGTSGSAAQPAAAGRPVAADAASGAPGYSYYQSMMSRYLSGGSTAPGWMRGGRLPASMMGTGTGVGQVMRRRG